MKKHKTQLVAIMTQKKYDSEFKILKKMVEHEAKQGVFKEVVGDVDERDGSLKRTKLSNGFDTQCGLRGGKLSGGQKQRCAIARTLIREPKVLLLDEATSALDEDSQKKVQVALESAMKGRTTIIIAHRLSTIQNCDKIYVLENGQVSEEGNFDELKAKGGLFTKISQAKNAS
jgi:ABC-type multidrug transport system fused ATPase/permease subunit